MSLLWIKIKSTQFFFDAPFNSDKMVQFFFFIHSRICLIKKNKRQNFALNTIFIQAIYTFYRNDSYFNLNLNIYLLILTIAKDLQSYCQVLFYAINELTNADLKPETLDNVRCHYISFIKALIKTK